MAKQTITKLIDDLDGGEAHETVEFGLDGYSYEIDLSSKNAGKLRHALATYVDHGTRVSGRSAGGRGGSRGRSAGSRNAGAAGTGVLRIAGHASRGQERKRAKRDTWKANAMSVDQFFHG